MSKNSEKAARTKQELTQAFWDLYERTPINRITVASVCTRAGYHRGTFYLHFHDVYQVLEEVETTLLRDISSCVEGCMQRLAGSSGKLARVGALKDVVLFYERNKRFIVVLLGPQGDAAFAARLKDVLKPLWKRYVVAPAMHDAEADSSLKTHSGQEIDLVLEFTLAGSLAMISSWLQNPQGVSAYDLGHLIYDTAIQNITATTARKRRLLPHKERENR